MDFLQTMDLHMNFRTGFVFHRNHIISHPTAPPIDTDITTAAPNTMKLTPSEHQQLETFLAEKLPLFNQIQGLTKCKKSSIPKWIECSKRT